jgi:hypothetical protein
VCLDELPFLLQQSGPLEQRPRRDLMVGPSFDEPIECELVALALLFPERVVVTEPESQEVGIGKRRRIGIIEVEGGRLGWDYMEWLSAKLGVEDLLTKARGEVET